MPAPPDPANGWPHYNCRCDVGPDGVWTDAGDARVCPMCMALGASWNASLDVPLTDAEADEILDRAGKKEVAKAIARDQTVADAVIADAAGVAESGVLAEQGIAIGVGGESLTIQVERRAVALLGEARARSAVPIGTQVRGVPITEGLVFESAGGRKRPVFVSVNIATGRTYRVIRRRGKYLLQTAGGRTIDSGDNLALILLLFAALEKARRDEEARTRELEAARENS